MDRTVTQLRQLRLILLGLVLVSAGCRSWHQQTCTPYLCGQSAGKLYVVDGAGDFRASTKAVQKAVQETNTPLDVDTFLWSHGYLRFFADTLDVRFARRQGRRLAAQCVQERANHPDCPIYLVGHSAGCWVTLSAVEAAPPGTFDRIILLSPATPKDYDLVPALTRLPGGMDVFWSCDDSVTWGVGLLFKFAKIDWRYRAAGRYGFDPVPGFEYQLRQHGWNSSQKDLDHNGGHYGTYQQTFLRCSVLPLLPGRDRFTGSDGSVGTDLSRTSETSAPGDALRKEEARETE
jgi:pimeloyl-ACP methyl ester carboxylesterase